MSSCMQFPSVMRLLWSGIICMPNSIIIIITTLFVGIIMFCRWWWNLLFVRDAGLIIIYVICVVCCSTCNYSFRIMLPVTRDGTCSVVNNLMKA